MEKSQRDKPIESFASGGETTAVGVWMAVTIVVLVAVPMRVGTVVGLGVVVAVGVTLSADKGVDVIVSAIGVAIEQLLLMVYSSIKSSSVL